MKLKVARNSVNMYQNTQVAKMPNSGIKNFMVVKTRYMK